MNKEIDMDDVMREGILIHVAAYQEFPAAYHRLPLEDRKLLCRELPGSQAFLEAEILTAVRLERRLTYLFVGARVPALMP